MFRLHDMYSFLVARSLLLPRTQERLVDVLVNMVTACAWMLLLVSGFSVLQVQGPCPFRIEVTNSFVEPHPPTVPLGREAALAANRTGASKKISTGCIPDSMPYDTGGRNSNGIQRAPINTTPSLVVSISLAIPCVANRI